MKIYDLLIIGGGPIGLACGIEAQKANLDYIIVEKGCLVNSIYRYPINMTFFSTSERLEIGGVPFISHGDKPTRREALDYYRRVASSWQLNLKLYEKVESIKKIPLQGSGRPIFDIHTSKNAYQAKNIVLATGFYDLPNLIGVKGEDLPKVKHYYDEPHPYAFQKIVVVGAANSAVDVALETYRKGAEVTMVIREPEIRKSVKYWVRPDIENRIKEGSIKAYFNSEITEIREREIDIKTPQGLITLENDFVLAMTGYLPNFDLLKMAGVAITHTEQLYPMYDSETQESNQQGVYLAGVVCGGMETNKWFIENSIVHSEKIIQHILKNSC
jgi:thioredoxin reductase (NADPH)